MKRLYRLVTLAAVVVALSVAQAQSNEWSPAMVGVGAHGYDWLIGTWSCMNSMPSPTGGPSSTTLTVARSVAGVSLFVRVSGKNFDTSSFIAYAPKTKRWSNPVAFADGSYGSEATTDTGKTTVWTGPFFSGSGKTMQTRDTYTLLSPTKFTDLGQYQSAGTWKTQYNTTCTKT